MNKLATEANIAASTINRPIREPDWPHGLSPRTIAKVHTASGIDPSSFMPNSMEEPAAMYLGAPMGKRPETSADRALAKLIAPDDDTTAEDRPNKISISVSDSKAQIVATVDKRGLEQLRRKIDALIAVLED